MDRDFRKGNSKAERRLHYYNSLFFGNTLQDMKLFNLKGYFSRLYKTQWEQLHKAKMNLNRKACLIRCCDLGLVTIGEVCAYLSAINRLITGVIGVGDVTYYVSIASQFRSRLSWVLGDINDYRQVSLDFSDVMAFIEMEPLLETSGSLLPRKQPVIEFKNVSFHYPNTDMYTLKNCSFLLDSGQTVGLVGLNGSGKSTIVKLLCRFYDPTEGQILIDHIDAREYDIVALRKLFGVLFQDYVKYSFSMRDNIALSDIERREDDCALQKACESSQVSELIADWSKGVEENLTRRFDPQGKELSGGQWQRVSLARAFFRDAPIVLLDEPSAALDPVAEHKIFADFTRVSEGKSAVMISHRLSSITLCDKIMVLEDGHIIEQGTHKELLEKDGRYAYLFHLQASKYI